MRKRSKRDQKGSGDQEPNKVRSRARCSARWSEVGGGLGRMGDKKKSHAMMGGKKKTRAMMGGQEENSGNDGRQEENSCNDVPWQSGIHCRRFVKQGRTKSGGWKN